MFTSEFLYATSGWANIPMQPLLVTPGTAWLIVTIALLLVCTLLWLLTGAPRTRRLRRARKPRRTPRPRRVFSIASAHRS